MKKFFYGTLVILTVELLLILVIELMFGSLFGDFSAFLIGLLLAITFVSAGYVSFYYALKFQQKLFNKIVGISIFGRLVVISLVIIVILKVTVIDAVSFLIGLFSNYFVFQIWEVISLNKLAVRKIG